MWGKNPLHHLCNHLFHQKLVILTFFAVFLIKSQKILKNTRRNTVSNKKVLKNAIFKRLDRKTRLKFFSEKISQKEKKKKKGGVSETNLTKCKRYPTLSHFECSNDKINVLLHVTYRNLLTKIVHKKIGINQQKENCIHQ